MLTKSPVQIVQQTLVQMLALQHVFIIHHKALIAVPDPAAGGVRPVQKLYGFHSLLPGHDAHAQMNAGIFGEPVHRSLETVQQCLIILLPLKLKGKGCSSEGKAEEI